MYHLAKMYQGNTPNVEIKNLWAALDEQKNRQQYLEGEIHSLRESIRESEGKRQIMQILINSLIEQIKNLSAASPKTNDDRRGSDTGSFITHDDVIDNNKGCCMM